MIRIDHKFLPVEVLPHIFWVNSKTKVRKFFGEYEVKVTSLRLTLFKEKGLVCVSCGLEGQYFYLEKNKEWERPHFNLYGMNKQGKEILFTKDHIYPKSKGGPNSLENLQTMCSVCNSRKADKI